MAMSDPQWPISMSLREWQKLSIGVWNTLKCTSIVDKRLAEDFLEGYSLGDSEDECFFTPPCSPLEIPFVNDHPKLLREFLVENSSS
jgi:hypothetical protein